MHELDLSEISHLVKQLVGQSIADLKTFDWGYISNYDPATHRVRCLVPAMRDDDGTVSLTGWMPLGSPFVGAGNAGIQWIPKAQATQENPTAGEQCMLVPTHPMRGQAAVPCMFFSGAQLPPAPQMPSGQPAAPGDYIIRTSGGTVSVLRDATGNMEHTVTGAQISTVTGDIQSSTQHGVQVSSTDTVTAGQPASPTRA